jgi:uncharacterized protein (DUF433 family)
VKSDGEIEKATPQKLSVRLLGAKFTSMFRWASTLSAQRGVCGGRPTFKYTRVEVAVVLRLLAAGLSIDELVTNFGGRISREAIEEAIKWAAKLVAKQGKAVAA